MTSQTLICKICFPKNGFHPQGLVLIVNRVTCRALKFLGKFSVLRRQGPRINRTQPGFRSCLGKTPKKTDESDGKTEGEQHQPAAGNAQSRLRDTRRMTDGTGTIRKRPFRTRPSGTQWPAAFIPVPFFNRRAFRSPPAGTVRIGPLRAWLPPILFAAAAVLEIRTLVRTSRVLEIIRIVKHSTFPSAPRHCEGWPQCAALPEVRHNSLDESVLEVWRTISQDRFVLQQKPLSTPP